MQLVMPPPLPEVNNIYENQESTEMILSPGSTHRGDRTATIGLTIPDARDEERF